MKASLAVLREMFDRFCYAPVLATRGAPHVRDANNIQRLLNNFVIASLPCALIGWWNLGEQIHFTMQFARLEIAPGVPGALLAALGADFDPASFWQCLLHGLLYFVPVFVTALLTATLWEVLFARVRARPLDEGTLYIAWLFALVMPPTIPMYQVVIGMSFGMVVGKGVFGGTGRYLVNPVVLGFTFMVLSYSNVLLGVGTWIPIPGFEEPTTLELAVEEGGANAVMAVGYTWSQLFVGNQPGAFGVTSPLACLLGAVYLVAVGAASWRIMAGSLAGLIGAVVLLQSTGPADDAAFAIPWSWHAVMGGWAFATVFLATDPVAAATTRAGRWAFGIIVGLLTIVVRLTNPSLFEGVMFAILLASIFSPLIDYVVVQWDIRQRRRRLEATA